MCFVRSKSSSTAAPLGEYQLPSHSSAVSDQNVVLLCLLLFKTCSGSKRCRKQEEATCLTISSIRLTYLKTVLGDLVRRQGCACIVD